MTKKKTPVREIRSIIDDSGDNSYVNRILIGTPTLGVVRVEWVAARYSQIIPVNWSQVQVNEYMNGYYATRYQVADAQNLIVKQCLIGDFEWLFLLEHDVCLPDMAFVALNNYMREAKYPVVSMLYYTRSRPSEPLIFRGRGTGAFTDWQFGDLVWCDGVPTGALLIHHSILREMWKDSPEYVVKSQVVRRVFETPRRQYIDRERGRHNTVTGTSDLDWCDRVMKGRDGKSYFEIAGWDMDFCPDPRYPFLVDTNLLCRHINMDGEQFP